MNSETASIWSMFFYPFTVNTMVAFVDAVSDPIALFTLLLSLVLACLFVVLAVAPTKRSLPPPDTSSDTIDPEIMSRLVDTGATLFGAGWCGYTVKQLEALGITESNTMGLDYVDCDADKDACEAAGVDAFPTWKIKGQLYPGYMDEARLRAVLK